MPHHPTLPSLPPTPHLSRLSRLSCLQYKFIVDGQWRHDPNLPSMYDDMGNINNVMEVQVSKGGGTRVLLSVVLLYCCWRCLWHCGAGGSVLLAALLVALVAGWLGPATSSAVIQAEYLAFRDQSLSLPVCPPIPAPAPQEYVPENLESLVGFDPPPSPPSRCAQCPVLPRPCLAWVPAGQPDQAAPLPIL